MILRASFASRRRLRSRYKPTLGHDEYAMELASKVGRRQDAYRELCFESRISRRNAQVQRLAYATLNSREFGRSSTIMERAKPCSVCLQNDRPMRIPVKFKFNFASGAWYFLHKCSSMCSAIMPCRCMAIRIRFCRSRNRSYLRRSKLMPRQPTTYPVGRKWSNSLG